MLNLTNWRASNSVFSVNSYIQFSVTILQLQFSHQLPAVHSGRKSHSQSTRPCPGVGRNIQLAQSSSWPFLKCREFWKMSIFVLTRAPISILEEGLHQSCAFWQVNIQKNYLICRHSEHRQSSPNQLYKTYLVILFLVWPHHQLPDRWSKKIIINFLITYKENLLNPDSGWGKYANVDTSSPNMWTHGRNELE